MSKFKKGDIVYYNAIPKYRIKNDVAYKVEDRVPSNMGYVSFTTRPNNNSVIIKIHGEYIRLDERDFISEKEYKEGEQLELDFEKPVAPVEQKISSDKPFEKGDVVYFIGDSISMKKDSPYEVLNCWLKGKVNGKNIYALTLKSEDGGIFSVESSDFILDDDYRKTTGQDFKKGDKVYYVGNNVNLRGILAKGKSYEIENEKEVAQEDLVSIRTERNQELFIPKDEFVDEAEYNKNRHRKINYREWVFNGNGSREPNIVENDDEKIEQGSKTNATIVRQLFQDTKNDKLKWSEPYTSHDEWFRSYIYLKHSKTAYLRFDLKRPLDEWELIVYYHKNKTADSVLVRKMRESKSILALVRKVKDSVEFFSNSDIEEEEDEYSGAT